MPICTNYIAPLWITEYGVSNPKGNGKWSSWVGFQYTGEGRVSGINGYVDRNRFTLDNSEEVLGPPSPPNPPQENGRIQ